MPGTTAYQRCLSEIEALSGLGIHAGLDSVKQALEKINNPQDRLKTLHIAGTNGKGSTSALLASILREAGFRTGLTISPHILDLRERIQINGEWIDQASFVRIHRTIKKKTKGVSLTYFEWIILMAFEYFYESQTDIVVLETGLGGRWDATNVTIPLVAALTNVALDHTRILGSTPAAILEEKMQIIKSGVRAAWTGIDDPGLLEILSRHCRNQGVPLRILNDYFSDQPGGFFSILDYDSLECALLGRHQKRNAALAAGMIRSLQELGMEIPQICVREGLKKVFWPGRLEWFQTSPPVLLDGAHNLAGIEALAAYLKSTGKKYHLCFGTLKDRPFEEMVTRLLPFAASVRWALFKGESRCLSEKELENVISRIKHPDARPERILPVTKKSWTSYLAGIPPQEPVLVTGSLYLVSAARILLGEFEDNFKATPEFLRR